jgi:SAM-dependent methyltransferase
MWSELILGLDLAPGGEILMAGKGVAEIELPQGAGQRWSNGDLAVITRGDPPAETATILASGLEANSMDLVILRDAGGSHRRLPKVLREAYRVLKPGGGLLMTELNAEALLDSTPQHYLQRLLSQAHPQVGEYLLDTHPAALDFAIEVVRAGFKDADSYSLDFPLGHFDDYQAHTDFVAVDGWRGLDRLSADDRDLFLLDLPDLVSRVVPGDSFFDLEPITVARGFKPV